MKPISPLLIEVAFKQYQEHGGGPHQGSLACSTKSAVGVLIEGGGFASVPRVQQGAH
jgi:hypothetical protein